MRCPPQTSQSLRITCTSVPGAGWATTSLRPSAVSPRLWLWWSGLSRPASSICVCHLEKSLSEVQNVSPSGHPCFWACPPQLCGTPCPLLCSAYLIDLPTVPGPGSPPAAQGRHSCRHHQGAQGVSGSRHLLPHRLCSRGSRPTSTSSSHSHTQALSSRIPPPLKSPSPV